MISSQSQIRRRKNLEEKPVSTSRLPMLVDQMTIRTETMANSLLRTTTCCNSGETYNRHSQISSMTTATRVTTGSRITSAVLARAHITTKTTAMTTRAITMGHLRTTITTGDRTRTMGAMGEISTIIMDRARVTSPIRTSISIRSPIRLVTNLILEVHLRAKVTRQILELQGSLTSMICSQMSLTFQRKLMTHSHPRLASHHPNNSQEAIFSI